MPEFSLNQLDSDERRYRLLTAGLGLLAGAVLIWLLAASLPDPTPVPPDPSPLETEDSPDFSLAELLLGQGEGAFPWPWTIQSVMWLMFCCALGELWVRFNRATREVRQLGRSPLPWNDEEVMFRKGEDLRKLYRWARDDPATRHYMLQRLTNRVVQQFQNSGSVDQASSVMVASMDLMQHEVDLKYNQLRYLVWLIPTLGFIGTVVGIAFALNAAADMPVDLQDPEYVRPWFTGMTAELGVAFYTTLLALLMAAVIVFLMHIAQEREEAALNTVGQCCIDHLLSRLVEADA